MLRGELLLNSTRCSNPQCRREIQALAFLKRIHRESTSARKELVIRCARQRPQRSTTPKPGPVYVPSNGAGGQSDEESSFLESSPNHRAGKPTAITRRHFLAFIPRSVWESRHIRRNLFTGHFLLRVRYFIPRLPHCHRVSPRKAFQAVSCLVVQAMWLLSESPTLARARS